MVALMVVSWQPYRLPPPQAQSEVMIEINAIPQEKVETEEAMPPEVPPPLAAAEITSPPAEQPLTIFKDSLHAPPPDTIAQTLPADTVSTSPLATDTLANTLLTADTTLTTDSTTAWVDIDTTGQIVYTHPQTPPRFPGGWESMQAFIKEYRRFPPESVARGAKGMVHISLIVLEDGRIANVRIKKGIGDADCEAEAIRLVRTMPAWLPAQQGGEPVKAFYSLPIAFYAN